MRIPVKDMFLMIQKVGLCMITFLCLTANAQVGNSDNQFQRPLKDVLSDIEQIYQVKLRIAQKDVEGKMLTYANWRFRPAFEETLKNVLAPFDLMFYPDGAPDKFKIEAFRYHIRSVREAVATLEQLAGKYSNLNEWETRREALKKCLLESIGLTSLPDRPGSRPILSRVRKMDGYTVQNIALEVFPGVYVCGSVYRPSRIKGKIPVILCPNGHFPTGRYYKDIQVRCATLARMGAVTINYDLFGWGESALQFSAESHRKSMANTMQALNSIRLLDYLLSLNYADPNRIGITGASGGGSHCMLMSAIDERIDVSVPVAMMSAIHYGGCPCESGNPIHLCEGGTNNVELAAMFAPKPQLIVSDGGDWTVNVPDLEFPFLKRVYALYEAGNDVENKHFQDEGHDYGPNKRVAMYRFMAARLRLDINAVTDQSGQIDESAVTIEKQEDMFVFGNEVNRLPENALKSFDELLVHWDSFQKSIKK